MGLALPEPEDLPGLTALTTWPGQLACFYVINGAQLGSAMLEKRIRASLPEAPVAFFATRCTEPGHDWPAFRRFLDQQALDEAQQDQAVACASRIFHGLSARLPGQDGVAAG